MATYCNPVNIPYQYQHYGKAAHREGADPTLILFKGRYYMFVSMCGGFYWSDDLINWSYHQNKNLDLYRYAPDVREVNGRLVFCASTRNKPSTFWVTDDPFAETYEKISEPFDFWDPDVFQDDDGRVYFYWGCDSGRPIYGVELDPWSLTPIGEKKEIIFGDLENHGWERKNYPGAPEEKLSLGMELLYFMMKISGHGGKDAPFIEGAFMNKWNGKYYLQYASPATEVSTYGDGVYVGDGPLGPFTYQAHNPYSFKPGGFITGAGHGSTIEDKFGNLWHAATMRISVNANFERRIGLFPAGLDADGILFCNQCFADYPLEIPEGKFDPMSVKPKWMLLSYKKPVTASSYLADHAPELAVNEDIRTSWCAAGSAGEWLIPISWAISCGRAGTTSARQASAHGATPAVCPSTAPIRGCWPVRVSSTFSATPTEPLGLGNPAPRFYWNCADGMMQTAYQIVCKRADEVVWDSGKVESSSMTHIRYAGQPLRSRDIVTWSVTLWDENGEPGETAESRFELGLLNASDWAAKWISGNYKPNPKKRYPADCFQKQFSAKGEITKARLYASARGVYDVTISGARLESFILAPGATDYRKRIQYQTYDVTALLGEQNTVELRLADGWFRGSVAAYGVTNVFGTQTSAIAQLEITYADGRTETIITDESWAWSNDGPIRFADTFFIQQIHEVSCCPSFGPLAAPDTHPQNRL